MTIWVPFFFVGFYLLSFFSTFHYIDNTCPILFYQQMNAGAVTLTDCVFWFVLVPYLTIKGYNLNFVSSRTVIWKVKLFDEGVLFDSSVLSLLQLIINMHTINVVFLLGDTALNCLVSCDLPSPTFMFP